MDIKAIKRKVVEQLVEGYEFATQLQLLLSKPFDHHLPGSVPDPADELMAKILASFDKTISVLGSFEPVSVSVSAFPLEGSLNSPSGDSLAAVSDVRCEDSGDSRKRPLGVNKGKRGCYKRKRKAQSWTVESNTLEDTHGWRKYGQKEILNAKHPRSYFRCTHKYTQGCKAIKQVQKLDHKPGMFQVTYIGDHTCKPNQENLTKIESSEIFADSENTCGSFLISPSDDKLVITGDIDVQSKAKQGVTVAGIVKEEETTNGEACGARPSTGDLSLVWQEDFMSLDEHELMYCCGETSHSHGVVDTDLVVFGSCDFVFGDNDEQLPFTDAYCV